MKIINCTEEQATLLNYIYPEGRASSYLALVPRSEYFFWVRSFTHLLDDLAAYFPQLPMRSATKLPIVQCVAKLAGMTEDGFLIPKVFKFGNLPENTFKDFGLNIRALQLLDTVSGTLPYPILRCSVEFDNSSCLGLLAWDAAHPAPNPHHKNLAQYITCIAPSRMKDIKIHSTHLVYDGKEYSSFLPTYNYYENPQFRRLLTVLNEQKLLTIPLEFPLNNLNNLLGFTSPNWAEVKPLEFFLDESPEKLDQYVLLRTDNGMIVTWDEVMNTPKLRLEIEMENYWLWQESCKTNEVLESLNLYWVFGMDYPWLIDKRSNTVVPVFVVED